MKFNFEMRLSTDLHDFNLTLIGTLGIDTSDKVYKLTPLSKRLHLYNAIFLTRFLMFEKVF